MSSLDSSISSINANLGDTDISSIGDGTVTGAISALNTETDETATFTGFTPSDFTFKKIGHIFEMDGQGVLNVSTKRAVIGTVASDAIPSSNVYGVGIITSSENEANVCRVVINAGTGDVSLHSPNHTPVSGTDYLAFSLIWAD